MKNYKVKIGVKVLYEVEIDIRANNATEAMNKGIEGYNMNLIPPVQAVHTTEPAIITVREGLTRSENDV